MWKIQPGQEIMAGQGQAITVTLTLGVVGWVMCMKHHLVMKNNCVK